MKPALRKPHWFDMLTGSDDGADATEAARFLCDVAAGHAEVFPEWLVGGAPVRLTLLDATSGVSTRIGFSGDRGSGEITLQPHDAGWLEVIATSGGREVFHALIDQPYQEFEIWPSHKPPRENSYEAPGRAGKKLSWICLSTTAWPALADAAGGDPFLNLSVVD